MALIYAFIVKVAKELGIGQESDGEGGGEEGPFFASVLQLFRALHRDAYFWMLQNGLPGIPVFVSDEGYSVFPSAGAEFMGFWPVTGNGETDTSTGAGQLAQGPPWIPETGTREQPRELFVIEAGVEAGQAYGPSVPPWYDANNPYWDEDNRPRVGESDEGADWGFWDWALLAVTFMPAVGWGIRAAHMAVRGVQMLAGAGKALRVLRLAHMTSSAGAGGILRDRVIRGPVWAVAQSWGGRVTATLSGVAKVRRTAAVVIPATAAASFGRPWIVGPMSAWQNMIGSRVVWGSVNIASGAITPASGAALLYGTDAVLMAGLGSSVWLRSAR